MAITITSAVTPGHDFASGEVVTPATLDAAANPTVATSISLATAKLLGRATAGTGSVEEIDCTAFARTVLDDTDASTARTTLGLGTISTQDSNNINVTGGKAVVDYLSATADVIAYSATTTLDLSNLSKTSQTVTLAGDVTFATSNKANGRTKFLRIICDGTARTFTFPSGWVFVGGTAPANISAGKTALLFITCYGTNETDIVASYAVQP